MEPGQVYDNIEMQPTSLVFKKGHRIRVDGPAVTSRTNRNPNTGHEFGMDAEVQIADDLPQCQVECCRLFRPGNNGEEADGFKRSCVKCEKLRRFGQLFGKAKRSWWDAAPQVSWH